MGLLILLGIIVGVYALGHLASDSGPKPKLAVKCPTCGVRSIETARKVTVVRGMILVFRRGSVSLIGCCQCVNMQVKANLATNALLGWWSFFGVIATPFCLLQNIYNLSRRPNIAKLKKVLQEVGVTYESVELNADGMATAQKTLLSAAASVLKTIAAVEGTASAEWEYARAALIALSDQTLTNQTADQLLSEAQPFTATSRNQFDEEQRLVLLRIAIDIATADGTISTDEETALINLGKNLGFDETLIKSLIQRLRGGSTDNEVAEARKVIGVTPEATIGEIRSAYKKLMLKHHPDRVEVKEREEATRISAEINAAYDLLIGRNQTKK